MVSRHLGNLGWHTSIVRAGERERQLLRLLARGEKEIAAGHGYDLSEVLDKADALLERSLFRSQLQ